MSKSLQFYEITPIVLQDYQHKFGNLSKILAFRHFLEADTEIHPDTLIVFTDGHDVCAVATPSGLKDSFQSYNVDVLLGAEKVYAYQLERHRYLFEEWFRGATHPYLNAGFVMGRKRSLLAFYRYLECITARLNFLPIPRSDQAIVSRAFVTLQKHRPEALRIGIDFDGRCITTIPAFLERPEIRSPLVHVTGLGVFPGQQDLFDNLYQKFVLNAKVSQEHTDRNYPLD
jgi:hypothetical protein